MMLLETERVGAYNVELHADDDAMSPREWDNVGRFCGLDAWTFNDHPADSVGDAYREARTGGPILALPVKVLNGPYTIVQETNDWSYADGIYWAAIAETEAIGDHGLRTIAELREAMRSEIADLNLWLAGDAYGYVVTDPDGRTIDSCWGYLGEPEYAMAEGRSAATWQWEHLPEWVRQTILAHAEDEA